MGLKFINGGGWVEVDVVYIWLVEVSGFDIFFNGIVFLGIVYWMFDCGLIGFLDDFDILILC